MKKLAAALAVFLVAGVSLYGFAKDQEVFQRLHAATHRYLSLGVDDGSTADAVSRFNLYANGKMTFGNGTDAVDVTFERLSAALAKITGGLTVTGVMTSAGIVNTGDSTGDGGDQMVGYLANQVAASTTALTAAQCGSTITGAAVQPLPEASTVLGCEYTFICTTTSDLDVNPADATDVLGITGSITGSNTTTVLAGSAGDAYRCTDVGSGFKLQAVAADLWAVESTNGIITDVN